MISVKETLLSFFHRSRYSNNWIRATHEQYPNHDGRIKFLVTLPLAVHEFVMYKSINTFFHYQLRIGKSREPTGLSSLTFSPSVVILTTFSKTIYIRS